jgi:NitT/TauT family transport system permease protein
MTTSITEHKLKVTIKKLLKTALTILFWLGLWLIVYKLVGLDVLIASPFDVGKRLVELLPNDDFWLTIFNSFKGISLGYIIGVLVGSFFGIITAFSGTLNTLLKPFLTAVKTTPVVSFIILALIWLDKVSVPIFITTLMVMPVVWANVTSSITNTDNCLIEMANAYNFGFVKKLKLIYLPSAVPHFVAACKTAVGLGWKAGIAAEVLCTPKNTIGINLRNSQVYLETIDLFAWTVIIIILSLVLEKLLVAILDFCFNKIMSKGGYFIENTDK